MGVSSRLGPPLTLPLLLLLSLGIQAVDADLHLTPKTLTVLRGTVVQFSCKTSNKQWTVMTWFLDDASVLTISNDTGVLPHVSAHVRAEPVEPSSPRDGWRLFLNTTEAKVETKVSCELQSIQRETATLSVEDKGRVELPEGDVLAFKDDTVMFRCEAAGWRPQPLLEWQVGKTKASPGNYNLSIRDADDGPFTATSVLEVLAVRSSQVTCLASVSTLRVPESRSVRLTVVTEAQEDECTVALAVMATLFAILLLLVIGGAAMWFVCRARARSGSDQATGLSLPHGKGGSEGSVRWKVNAGFCGEEPTDAVNNESGCETASQMDSVGIGEVPDVVSSSNLSLHRDSRAQSSLEGSYSVRRITTV